MGAGGIPTPFYAPGLNDPRKKPALIIVGKTDRQKENWIPLPYMFWALLYASTILRGASPSGFTAAAPYNYCTVLH